jgi:halimadienyl-diphosphate synthase
MRDVSRVKPASVNADEGITSGVAYDTAWVAQVTDESGKLIFPECVKWLLDNQKSDGSWGCQIQNYHDRLLSTLSAVIALKEIDENRYGKYIQKGETYIWENLKKLEQDNCKLVASELLLPSLMEQAESLKLNLPYHIKVYKREYHLKLENIEESLWYSPLTTLSFSLEFLGDNVDENRLANVQLPNGSVATSPAATAFFLKHTRDEKAFMYLKEVLSVTGDGSVITTYPMEIFEYSWAMYNLMMAGLYFERYTEICDFLFKHLRRSGVGCSVDIPLTDADDTAVVCKILYDMQYPIDFRVFNAYDTGDCYSTYGFEIDPSVSTNVHVLDFVQNCPEFPDREETIEKLIQFLKKEMYSGFWLDKWHISPYYPTAHAVFALCDVEPSLTEKAISWIFETQNEDGTWGENGTLEETVYGVQTLLYYHQKVDYIDMDKISKALSYFDTAIVPLSKRLPELWIGKILYCPVNVILSSIVGASTMYNATVWNLCSGWYV